MSGGAPNAGALFDQSYVWPSLSILNSSGYTGDGPGSRAWYLDSGVRMEAEYDGTVWKPVPPIAFDGNSISKVALISESILGAGDFPNKFAALSGAVVDKTATLGGSHIGSALIEFSRIKKALGNGENLCKNSEVWTNGQNGWSIGGAATVEAVTYRGEPWNLCKKTDASMYAGPKYAVGAIPASGTGFYVSFEIYSESVSSLPPMSNITIVLRNETTSSNVLSVKSSVPTRSRMLFQAYAPASSFTFGSGNTFQLQIHLNRDWEGDNNNQPACSCYLRAIEISWNPINGYAPYVKTAGSAVAAGSKSWMDMRESGTWEGYDTALLSFGRNESNDVVSPRAHYDAYLALIGCVLDRFGRVVPGNPPPYNNSGSWDIQNDAYTKHFSDLFRKIMYACGGSGVDVWDMLQKFDPSIVMADSWHQSNFGSDLMARWYLDALRKPVIRPLSRTPIAYWGGDRAGTWTGVTSTTFDRASRYGGSSSPIGAYSSTINDTVVFALEACSHVMAFIKRRISGGTYSVIIDEGTSDERVYNYTTSYIIDGMVSRHICANLPYKTHTLKIKVTSANPVEVYGVVAL